MSDINYLHDFSADTHIKLLETILVEEVIDCGPLIDLKMTPGCKRLQGRNSLNIYPNLAVLFMDSLFCKDCRQIAMVDSGNC